MTAYYQATVLTRPIFWIAEYIVFTLVFIIIMVHLVIMVIIDVMVFMVKMWKGLTALITTKVEIKKSTVGMRIK
jgi:hypothetical protein